MPNQRIRQLMIENLQDSLRLIRHKMNFDIEKFAEAIGVTRHTINDLETKRDNMTATQYVAVIALMETYFKQNPSSLVEIKEILDNDGKNYGEDYETSFLNNSLLKRWFEDFITFDNEIDEKNTDDENFEDDSQENFEDSDTDILLEFVYDHKIFIDAAVLKDYETENFVQILIDNLEDANQKAIMPLRSIEELKENSTSEEFSHAMDTIKKMQAANVLQIYGDDADPNFSKTILEVFKRLRYKYNLCLITPDEKLAENVLRLNNSAESDYFIISVGFVKNGNFYLYDQPLEDEIQDDSNYFYENEETNSYSNETPDNKFNRWEEL